MNASEPEPMSDKSLVALAEEVRAARVAAGLTKVQAAIRAGVSPITWKRVEDGLRVQDSKLGLIRRSLNGQPVEDVAPEESPGDAAEIAERFAAVIAAALASGLSVEVRVGPAVGGGHQLGATWDEPEPADGPTILALHKEDVEQNGAAIRALRQKDGYTAEAFAAQIGASYSHYRNIENGHRVASAELINRIARTLGVPVTAILRQQADAPPPMTGSSELDAWRRLGEAVKRARMEQGLRTGTDWSVAVGRSTRVLLGLERGESVGPDTLSAIETVLGWTPGRASMILNGAGG